jgi:ABC-type transport system involved in cytochrome c biogenesis permease subunit
MTSLGVENLFLLVSLAIWLIFILACFVLKIKNDKTAALPALIFQLCWIVYRVSVVHHVPFSGMYESLVFFSFLYALKVGFFTKLSIKAKRFLYFPIILMLLTAFLLSPALKEPRALSPALESFWIYFHVPAFFISYVSITIGFVLVLLNRFGSRSMSDGVLLEMKYACYFTAIGLVTGGIWGQQSWGIFWNWDPKEIGALIIWIWTIAYFHTKSMKLKQLFVCLAFLSMVFTYFVITFGMSGLHSYR